MTKLKDCPYRVGLTGTLDGSKTHKLVIEGLFGKVQKVITTKDLMDKKLLSPLKIKCIVLDHTNKNKEACKDLKYPQEIELIINNKERNEFIRDLTTKTKGNTLVLFQYVEKHGKILYEMIKKKETKRKVFFVFGGTEGETREQIRAITEKEARKREVILFHFGNNVIECNPDENVVLSNKTTKLAKDITENDDIEENWIINKNSQSFPPE